MYIRSFTLCLLHLLSSVLQRPSSNIRNNTGVYFRSLTWVYCICHQVYCRGHHLTLGTTLRCTLGASLRCAPLAKWSAYPIMYIRSLTWCTVNAKMCTEYAIMYIKSFTWVYCICHQVYCRDHHLTSRTTLG